MKSKGSKRRVWFPSEVELLALEELVREGHELLTSEIRRRIPQYRRNSSNYMRRLSVKGLVETRRAPGRTQKLWSITRAGRIMVEAMRKAEES